MNLFNNGPNAEVMCGCKPSPPTTCSAHLLEALQRGTVRNAGGVLIDWQCSALGMTFDELYTAVQDLRASGYRVERIDAGGAPEWALLPSTSGEGREL